MSLGPGPTRAGGLYASEGAPNVFGGCGGGAMVAALATQAAADIDPVSAVAPTSGAPVCISSPSRVPGSGAGNSATIITVNSPDEPIEVCGVPVTCVDTGVTLFSTGSNTFYGFSSGTASFASPGGPGGLCPSDSGHTFASGSTICSFGNPGFTANLVVNQLT